MKKYLLFVFNTYYPMGGIDDFLDSFDSVEEAVSAAENKEEESYEMNFQIIDRDTFKLLHRFVHNWIDNTFIEIK